MLATTEKPRIEKILTSQEQAIESGSNVMHGTVTDRVLRMYEAIRGYGPPRVTLDRAVLFTESFKETENQPLVLRWAKALKHFAEKVPVTIFPDELIVGRPNTWLGRWGIVYPELDGDIMPSGVEMFRKNKGQPGEVVVTEEDAKVISEVLTPYWTGKDYATDYVKSLPPETRFMVYGPDPKNTILMTVVVFASSPMRHSQNWTPDWSKILTRGVKGIREEAKAKLAALSEPRDLVHKKPFLEAVIITCDAMTTWSRRYAKLATELAAKEKNPAAEKRAGGNRGGMRMGSRRILRARSARRCRRSGGARSSTASSRRRAPSARAEWISICCRFTGRIWLKAGSQKNRRWNCSTVCGSPCRRSWN